MLPEMSNPWKDITGPRGSYVLDMDRPHVRSDISDSHKIKVVEGSIPEPFIGDPFTARVVFLGLNPGHSDEDQKHYQINRFRDALFANLRHDREQEYPFYPLNPAFKDTPVAHWWRNRTEALIVASKLDIRSISQRIMVVEWYPYHSLKFRASQHRCKSQEYSYELVRRLRDDGRFIVGMRGKRLWSTKIDAIPYLDNPQCSFITPGNAKDGLFERILAALKRRPDHSDETERRGLVRSFFGPWKRR
jgi:hypothetical protein